MLEKLEAIDKYPTAKFKMTMHLEYDVLLALQPEIATYPNRPIIKWVESHQNERHNEEELKLDAILNIEADALATEGLKNGFLKQKSQWTQPHACKSTYVTKQLPENSSAQKEKSRGKENQKLKMKTRILKILIHGE